MTEYDDTNSGVAFPPFQDQKLVLSGKLNIDGNETQCVFVKGITKSGKEIMKIYQQVGIMFQNDNVNESAPSWSGTLNDDKKIAGWKRSSTNTPSFLSLKISEKDEKKIEQPTVIKNKSENDFDEIPF